MFFFSDDVLRKHVGPSSMQKYRKVTDYGTKCYFVSPISLLRLVFLSPSFIKKRLQHTYFLVNILRIFKNNYFEEHLRTAVSAFSEIVL